MIRWVTIAELSSIAGVPRRTLAWACKKGNLAQCHRRVKNPKGGPQIVEINLAQALLKFGRTLASSTAQPADLSLFLQPSGSLLATALAAAFNTVFRALPASELKHEGVADLIGGLARVMVKKVEGDQPDSDDHRAALISSTFRATREQLEDAQSRAKLIDEVATHMALQKKSRPNVPERKLIEQFLTERRRRIPETPSISGFYRFRRLWLSSGKNVHALIDHRKEPGKGVCSEFSEEAFFFFCSLYLSANRPSGEEAYRRLKGHGEREGWKIPSLATVMRRVNAQVPKEKQAEFRGRSE